MMGNEADKTIEELFLISFESLYFVRIARGCVDFLMFNFKLALAVSFNALKKLTTEEL